MPTVPLFQGPALDPKLRFFPDRETTLLLTDEQKSATRTSSHAFTHAEPERIRPLGHAFPDGFATAGRERSEVGLQNPPERT